MPIVCSERSDPVRSGGWHPRRSATSSLSPHSAGRPVSTRRFPPWRATSATTRPVEVSTSLTVSAVASQNADCGDRAHGTSAATAPPTRRGSRRTVGQPNDPLWTPGLRGDPIGEGRRSAAHPRRGARELRHASVPRPQSRSVDTIDQWNCRGRNDHGTSRPAPRGWPARQP